MRNMYISIILALLIITPLSVQAASIETGTEPGKYAPAFELRDITGKKVHFTEYKGKVILLNFWATYCVPCRKEMPSMERLYNELKGKGFVVVAISIDPLEKSVRSFVKKSKITFPILMDKEKEVYFDLYAVFTLPTSFLIDKNGVIVEKYFGEKEWDSGEMKSKVLTLLGKKGSSVKK